ncbi:MAG: hypothetical protein H0W25_03045, partial [Acidimicrobiia bacterium]|nr:hypothetical protein [Acidimicrobiia bacterium]
ARADRALVDDLSPLVAHHLGHLDRGPLTDVDAALLSLAAVKRLQFHLGAHLDEARLQDLLFADAFHSPAVIEPAANIQHAVGDLVGAIGAAGEGGSADVTIDALHRWVGDGAALLPTVTTAADAVAGLGVAAASVRDLVDLLLLRERVQDLVVGHELRLAHAAQRGAS